MRMSKAIRGVDHSFIRFYRDGLKNTYCRIVYFNLNSIRSTFVEVHITSKNSELRSLVEMLNNFLNSKDVQRNYYHVISMRFCLFFYSEDKYVRHNEMDYRRYFLTSS